MSEYSRLFSEVLMKKKDLSEEKLQLLIQEKKDKVGSGYLTDQGAIFLIASDLGLKLTADSISDLTLNDLHIGANEITVLGRIFAVYPSKQFTRRDSTTGSYRQIILMDSKTYAKVSLWDEHVMTSEDLNIRPGMLIRVSKGYVKPGLDGKPVLNVGSRSSLEIAQISDDVSKFSSIDAVTLNVNDIPFDTSYLSIKGNISSLARSSEFTRKDGSKGRLTQFTLSNIDDADDPDDVRVVIWGDNFQQYLDLKLNCLIRLVNVKSKNSSNEAIELHGNEGSSIEVMPPDSSPSLIRILSFGQKQENTDQISLYALSCNENGTFYNVSLAGNICNKVIDSPQFSLFQCNNVTLSNSTIICNDENSLQFNENEIKNFPNRDRFAKKIKSLNENDDLAFVECISLSNSLIDGITDKKGSIINRGELDVGDDTGHIKIIAWKGFTSILEGINSGQRLFLNAFSVKKTGDNSIHLEPRDYSSIDKYE